MKDNLIVGHYLIISASLFTCQPITNSPIRANSSLSFPKITLLKLPKVTVEFLWVLSHVGITHNETVDHLAKQTSILGSPSNTLPLSEIYPLIRRSTYMTTGTFIQ